MVLCYNSSRTSFKEFGPFNLMAWIWQNAQPWCSSLCCSVSRISCRFCGSIHSRGQTQVWFVWQTGGMQCHFVPCSVTLAIIHAPYFLFPMIFVLNTLLYVKFVFLDLSEKGSDKLVCLHRAPSSIVVLRVEAYFLRFPCGVPSTPTSV